MTNPINFLQMMLQRTMGRGAAAAVPAADEVSKAYVLTSAGGGRFDQIYTGVVGSLDAEGKFAIHPDYHQIAYLFSLAGASELPAISNDRPQEILLDPESPDVTVAKCEKVLQVQLPASAMKALRANMIDLSSRRWEALYKSVASLLPGGAMIEGAMRAEAAGTKAKVESYIAAAGLRTFDVPVMFEATVDEEDPAQRGATEKDVLALAGSASDITLMPLNWADGAPVDRALNPQMAAESAAADTGALPAQWMEHQGPLQLRVEGSISVQAANVEQAHKVAAAMLQISKAAPHLIGEYLKPVARYIQFAQLLPPTADRDDEDGDEGYRWGGAYRG